MAGVERIVVKGVSEVKAGLKKKQDAVDARMYAAAKLMGAEATRTIKLQIKGAHKRGTQTPSQIGSPPTNISGNLRRSVTFNTTRVGYGSYKIVAEPTMIYARQVELGGGRWTNGANYPYVAPAAKLLQRNGRLIAIYRRAIENGLKA